MYKSRFTLKMILLSTLPILFFSIFSITVVFYRIEKLGSSASEITGSTLNSIYVKLLEDKSRDITEKVSLKINTVLDELNILRGSAQEMIDREPDKTVWKNEQFNSWIEKSFIHNHEKNWSNIVRTDMNISMSVWGYLHNEDGTINQKTRNYISMMSPILMLMKSVGGHGTPKGWFYVTGPKETPVMIMTPWEQMPEIFDREYPGHNENNWWDFFFPGIVESWNEWIKKTDFARGNVRNEVTLTPVYEDAGGTGLMVTFFAPLWNRARSENSGAAAVDYNVHNILDIVKNEKVGDTGFTFLMQSDGNALGVTDGIAKKLELSQVKDTDSGVDAFYYNLKQSRINGLAEIAEKFNSTKSFTTYRFTDSKGKDFLLSFDKILDYNLWNGKNAKIDRESLYIAAIVPREEIFRAQREMDGRIKTLSHDTTCFLIGASAFFGLLSIFLAAWYALQNTRQIRKMSQGIAALGEKNYGVSIDVISQDELGDLAKSFNHMTGEIYKTYRKLESYAHDLENKVKERTTHLEEANLKLQELSQIDGLTGVHNRRHFDQRLDETWREYSRLNHPVSVIMIDIDHFKKYNDNYGHQAGDACLCAVATALKKQARRSSDLVARYGGEEFVVIACIDIDAAFKLAEDMRLAVKSLAIEHMLSEKNVVSISLGVASTIPSQNTVMEKLVRSADMALYKSKENGRDMVSQFHLP